MTAVEVGHELLASAADVATADEAFLTAARPYWHPVAASASLAPGSVLPVTLLGEGLALWRRPDGEPAAVTDACVHRGVRLSTGTVTAADGCLTCPYHGWRYGSDGRCTGIPQLPNGPIPAAARVPSFDIDEHAGLLWVRLDGDGGSSRPTLPESADPAFVLTVGDPFDWACQSTRQIENFLDVAHFSHIHLDVFGNPDRPEVPAQPVRVVDGHLLTEVTYPGIDPMAVATGGDRAEIDMPFRYDVQLPFSVRLESGDGAATSVLFLANQPIDAHRCRVWWVMAQPAATALPDEVVQLMERMVFGADQAVVETQRPDAVPLAVTAELHLPFDKVAVAYRRALLELGFPLAPGR